MKEFEQGHVFASPWNIVTSAFWFKYPNPFQRHVLRVDTLNREVDLDTQQMRSLRLLTLRYPVAGWIRRLAGRDWGFGLEESVLDMRQRVLTIHSKNVTLARFMTVSETCIYRPHPDKPNEWTLYTQKAEYRVHVSGWLNDTLETKCVQTATEKAHLGIQAMLLAVNRLRGKG